VPASNAPSLRTGVAGPAAVLGRLVTMARGTGGRTEHRSASG
jgi:hypothetical protein